MIADSETENRIDRAITGYIWIYIEVDDFAKNLL
jgi:hypothetical protein